MPREPPTPEQQRLAKRGKQVIDFRDVIRLGPSAVRTKAAADEAFAILAAHGWIAGVSARPRRVRLVNDEAAG